MISEIFRVTFTIVVFVASCGTAIASDDINCSSPSWAVVLSVGGDGYVPSMVVDDKKAAHFREPIVITNLSTNARHADVNARTINVKAKTPNGKMISISMTDGNGRIRFWSTTEKLVCDWTT